jgi:hypothetical protein
MPLTAKTEPVPFAIGDVVRLKKPHPCGGYDWTVVRLGADIGLKCHGCGRRVLLPRRELERRLKRFLQRAAEQDAAEVEAQQPDPAGPGIER